eukprot:gnl/MRDRNA2_/MRDRNA2_70219_c0_seq1.p1 gnl/MRDRNA2_/MRDRNA2_70219_c0~~gnl/MRDRNA2_/MRDRNA2_70219_c0_seq1.p1  ORF type:complete len:408 (+),score=123.47 gnl/MRDRNA2_/MRDRNA2_70219_c0_seq1:79-1224(+)
MDGDSYCKTRLNPNFKRMKTDIKYLERGKNLTRVAAVVLGAVGSMIATQGLTVLAGLPTTIVSLILTWRQTLRYDEELSKKTDAVVSLEALSSEWKTLKPKEKNQAMLERLVHEVEAALQSAQLAPVQPLPKVDHRKGAAVDGGEETGEDLEEQLKKKNLKKELEDATQKLEGEKRRMEAESKQKLEEMSKKMKDPFHSKNLDELLRDMVKGEKQKLETESNKKLEEMRQQMEEAHNKVERNVDGLKSIERHLQDFEVPGKKLRLRSKPSKKMAAKVFAPRKHSGRIKDINTQVNEVRKTMGEESSEKINEMKHDVGDESSQWLKDMSAEAEQESRLMISELKHDAEEESSKQVGQLGDMVEEESSQSRRPPPKKVKGLEK